MRDHERVSARARTRIVFKEMSGGEPESKRKERKREEEVTHIFHHGAVAEKI